eukprot:1359123-Prymnesium_polylepis.1
MHVVGDVSFAEDRHSAEVGGADGGDGGCGGGGDKAGVVAVVHRSEGAGEVAAEGVDGEGVHSSWSDARVEVCLLGDAGQPGAREHAAVVEREQQRAAAFCASDWEGELKLLEVAGGVDGLKRMPGEVDGVRFPGDAELVALARRRHDEHVITLLERGQLLGRRV